MNARGWLKRILVLAVVSGCTASGRAGDFQGGPAVSPPTPSSPVVAWLDCMDECSPEQLRVIVAQGDAAVPLLGDVLNNGPSKDRLDSHQKHLEETYRALQAYERNHPERKVPIAESDYVSLYQKKYITLNKTRAAKALGAINTPQARTVLQQALRSSPPADVRRAIDSALKTR